MSKHNLKIIPPSGYEMVPDGDKTCQGNEMVYYIGEGWVHTTIGKGDSLPCSAFYCRPIATPATPSTASWPKPFKTIERAPSQQDAINDCVLAHNASNNLWSVIVWEYVSSSPKVWPQWLPLPPIPEPDHTEAEKAWEVFDAENKIGPSSLINYKQFWIAAYELGKSARNL